MSVHQSCTIVRFRPLLNHYSSNVPQIFQTSNNHGRAKNSALLRVQVHIQTVVGNGISEPSTVVGKHVEVLKKMSDPRMVG